MAQVNRDIGECLVCRGDDEYLIRPTFKALAAVEDLEWHIGKVCDAYNVLMSEHTPDVTMLSACANFLSACSNIPDAWLGYSCEIKGSWKWRQSILPTTDLVILAHHCVRWGVQGDPKEKLSRAARKKLEEQPQRDFDPSEFVAVLIDEFGVSNSDAWQMTMTEFQRLCEHRNRKNWGDRPPPVDDEERDNLLGAYQQFLKNKAAMKAKEVKNG